MVCAVLSCQWSRPVSQPLPDALSHTLSSHLDLGKSRLETLSWLIIGPMNARAVNLSHLACQCSSAAQVASPRRARRTAQEPAGQALWLQAPAQPKRRASRPWTRAWERRSTSPPNGLAMAFDHRKQRPRPKGPPGLPPALANRMPLRRQQDPRPQHGGHPHHPARQAQHPAGHHHTGRGLGRCLRDSHHGQQANQATRPRIPRQILVPARLRSAQKVDPPSAR